MLRLIHRTTGPAGDVLELANVPPLGAPVAGEVRIRVALVCVHPGDVQVIEGSPASGGPRSIGDGGRCPGFEGIGFIEALGERIDARMGLSVGQLVAYFAIRNGWSEQVFVPAASLVVLPDNIRANVAAQALVNTIAAEVIIRAAREAWPSEKREVVTVIQTGAASAVGRIITALLTERGANIIRLVRSVTSASLLDDDPYPGPVIATEKIGWQDALKAAVIGKELYVAVDGVGGEAMQALTEILNPGGTILSYGALSGRCTDIRSVVPRGLTIKGVHIGQWTSAPEGKRKADVETALRLAATKPELFPVTAIYPADQIKKALAHLREPGRNGAILLSFSEIVG